MVPETDAPLGVVPTQQRGREKRRRLLEAAMKEYAQRGVDAARVEDIVEAAETGWGTFFHYFPRKEDVLLVAAVDQQGQIEQALDAALEHGGPMAVRTALEALSRATARGEHPEHLHAAMIREVMASPIRFHQMLGDRQPLFHRITEILRLGQQSGEVRSDIDAEMLGVILNTAILATAARVGFSVPPEHRLEEWVVGAFSVLWEGIGRRP